MPLDLLPRLCPLCRDDTIIGDDNDNLLIGGAGEDTLQGGKGDDLLMGQSGVDDISGGEGDDIIDGGAEGDTIDGGPGTDTISYATSNRRVIVDLSQNTGTGGDARGDELTSIENIIGSEFDDTLTGDDGPNEIFGGAGHPIESKFVERAIIDPSNIRDQANRFDQ